MKNMIVFSMILCLVLGNYTGAPLPNEESILPDRESVDEVSSLVSRTMSGEFYAVANESESAAILSELYKADLSGLEDTDISSLPLGAGVSFKLKFGDEARHVEITTTAEAQYLVIKYEDWQPQFVKKCPANTFSFNELNRLRSSVFANKEDPLYSGRVEIPDLDFKTTAGKYYTAFVQSVLENGIYRGEYPAEDVKNITYDILLRIGDTLLYGINSETGHIFRQSDGKTVYAQIGKDALIQFRGMLGIPIPVPELPNA